MNIFLLSFVPKVCPACGEKLQFGKLGLSDFLNGCSHTCDCGAKFQYVQEKQLVELASKTGDMGMYIK